MREEEEDEEAETVELNGVAAARGRRLKSQKAGQNEDPVGSRGTPGNAASAQPYEPMPVSEILLILTDAGRWWTVKTEPTLGIFELCRSWRWQPIQ